MTNFLITFGVNKDPESWSHAVNMIYYGISRVLFSVAVSVVFLVIVLGHMEPARVFLTNSYFRALGKISFIGALIYPMIILVFLGSMYESYYITFFSTFFLGMGNILSAMLSGLVIYVTLEY